MTEGAEPCPVAALADEMRRHVEIDEKLDALRFAAEAQSEKDRLERLVNANLTFFREGVRDRAIFLRTQSAKGALLQLCLINERIDALHELTSRTTPRRRRPSRRFGPCSIRSSAS